MSSILDRIFAAKRTELERSRAVVGEAEVRRLALAAAPAKPFLQSLLVRRPAIIAEVKRASPSKGDILPDLDPVAVAMDYAQGGAAAISVLTDVHFKGSLADLRAVRAAVDLPLLRKDFMFDPYQVYEARAAGADCILLIAAMLDEDTIRGLQAIARSLGMASLVEVHDSTEMAVAQRVGAELIGINNRNLHTFVTNIEVTERLLAEHPGGAPIVTESGIETPQDIQRLDRAGARAFLVGESLLRGGRARERLAALARALG